MSKKGLGEHLLPLSAEQTIAAFGSSLLKYELAELLDYHEVYYLGLKAKKIHPSVKFRNMGFDDKETDYIIIIGDHIAYQYEVLEVLGAGSFAQVCKCWDHKNKIEVAIKIIKSHSRFQDQGQVELKVLDFLKKHGDRNKTSSFAQMLEYFIFRNHLCIVFELLSFTLFDLLKANHFKGFSTTLVRRFTSQILTGLAFLRSNKIIHCDLKPENIILVNPLESSIKIIDFGSSCFESERIYYYIQSRIYRAPEVILGIPYTSAIDMWSLGCIIVELSTGSPLFQGENEYDQLFAIMEVMGNPPESMMRLSQKKSKFFNNDYTPKSSSSLKSKVRIPASKKLEEKALSSDLIYLDFLKSKIYAGCLEWVPEKRITPFEALSHPWMKEAKKIRVNNYSKPAKSPRLKIT